MDLLIAALGLVILLLAGDALVKGAVNLSLRLGIPALIVSLTIVAFGTSAPELLIAVQAIGEGAPGLALGNVVGSNTANVLLVLGVPALITTLHSSVCDSRKSYLQMMAATALFIGVAWFGPITWVHGIVLLAALAWMLMSAIGVARCHRRDVAAVKDTTEPGDVEGADPDLPGWKIAMYLLVGIVGLPLGADLLVESATSIARAYNVSDTVIGLTLVAVGTSLPELATTVMAALRKQADVALGNVIGSNMFNLLAIIGLSSFVGDIPVDPGMLRYDMWVMAGASALLALFVLGKRDISRTWGVLLVALYIGYISMILISAGTMHA
jgi:cation:H+ antiporter